jgi:hypothetical protein
MLTLVVPQTGFYIVGTLDASGLQTEQVNKHKHCTCGGTGAEPCPHIQAVATYLKLGGDRAPAPEPEASEPTVELPEVCPICGGTVRPQGRRWRCVNSSCHYWQHRGEQSGVKAFLTQPHPAKQGAFYEQSIEEREAFLEHTHRQLYANGYTPYG